MASIKALHRIMPSLGLRTALQFFSARLRIFAGTGIFPAANAEAHCRPLLGLPDRRRLDFDKLLPVLGPPFWFVVCAHIEPTDRCTTVVRTDFNVFLSSRSW